MSGPASKRRRVRSDSAAEDTDAVAPPTVKRSEKFWLEDGNVILQVEDTQFRVHRSMLTRHSAIFRDMFGMPPPQPDQPQDPVVEGCPVITLSDRADDVAEILSIFYDNVSFLDLREHLPIDRIAAMLRLGKKYDIGYLRDEALKRLRSEFSTTLDGFDAAYGDAGGPSIDYRIPSSSNVLTTIIRLAHEHGIPSIMPAACLNLVYNTPLQKILSDNDLPQELRNQCILGRDDLIRAVHSLLNHWADLEAFMSPARCTGSPGCDRRKMLHELDDALWMAADGTVWSISPTIPANVQENINKLCTSCAGDVVLRYHRAREVIWGELPRLFGFPPWDQLKDFDS